MRSESPDITNQEGLPPTRPVTIPLEICYSVIECLHSSKPELARCSLVCQAWLHSTRSHLFHTLDLVPEYDTSGLFSRRPKDSGLPIIPLKTLSEIVSALPRIQVLKLIALRIDLQQSDDIAPARKDSMTVYDEHRHRRDRPVEQFSLEELLIRSCSSSRGLVHTVEDTNSTLRIFRSIGCLVWEVAQWSHPTTTYLMLSPSWLRLRCKSTRWSSR
ncbi:hypothetical protein C8Q80DRAFT_226135 [Daedaleopsis nitida]|nr:hypothetical protein C8Q80DRAFT_226135 [Daedaleopsis nitida]